MYRNTRRIRQSRNTMVRPFNYIVSEKSGRWLIKSQNYTFNILRGAIRSGKDMTGAIAFVERIKASKGSLFMVGATSSDKGMRIVGQYVMDYLGGLAYKTQYNNSTAIRFDYKGTTKFIVFANGYNKNSQDFIQGDTYNGIYLTEINLLNPEFIDQAIKRTVSDPDRFIFGTYNPRGKKHWFNTSFMEIWRREQADDPNKNWLNYESLNMKDNPIFTEEMLQDAAKGMDPNSLQYKRDILNMELDAVGTMYTVRDYNKLTGVDYTKYDRYITIKDIGESISSTVFLTLAVYYNEEEKRRELHALDMYHHINRDLDDIQKKSPIDYINDYTKYIQNQIEKFGGKHPEKILFDGTDQLFRDIRANLRDNNLGQHTPKRVDKDDMETRIYRMQSLLFQGLLKISQNNCQLVIDELSNADYDAAYYERTGKLKRLEVFTEYGHQDTLAALEYGSTYYKFLVK